MKRMWSKNELKNIGSQQAKEVIESGLVDNAKPIYCHPLEIYLSGRMLCTALIMNNTSDEINTYDKLKTEITKFKTVGGYKRLHVAGTITIENVNYVMCEIAYKEDGAIFSAVYTKTDGSAGNETITNLVPAVVDAYNKIN